MTSKHTKLIKFELSINIDNFPNEVIKLIAVEHINLKGFSMLLWRHCLFFAALIIPLIAIRVEDFCEVHKALLFLCVTNVTS